MSLRRWGYLAAVLFVLACLVPFSSRRPDAIQRVIGLPGGVDSALKAMGGIVAAACFVMILVWGLRRVAGKR